jgi:hypothetical protein
MHPHSDTHAIGKHRRTVLAATLLLAFCGAARADQDVTSSDGQWKLHAKVPSSFSVKGSGEAIIDVKPAAGGKGCPTVSSVVFEMPAHGHGGGKTPEVMTMDACQFHVSNLAPTMGGAWRLRLVLKDGAKTSNADFDIGAK